MVDPAFSGGAYLHNLCEALAARGCEVELLTGPAYHRSVRPGTPVGYRLRIGFYRRTQLRSYVRGWARPAWRLLRILGHLWSMSSVARRGAAFDIVHAHHLPLPELDVWWLPWIKARAPLVVTVHNVYPHERARTRRLRHALHRTYHTADHLIAHTHYTVNGLLRDFSVPPDRITRIPHGRTQPLAGEAVLPPREDGGHQVLWFGQIRPEKALDVLIRALRHVLDDGVPCRLVVAGAAEADMDVYRDLARQLGVTDAVDFQIGFVPETAIARLFAAATVVALPYRAIDQSGVAIMAVSLGRAIVASRVGGLAELVDDAGCGLLVPVNDDVAFAAALRRMICDPPFRTACETNARRYAETTLSWGPIAERTEQVYRRLLAVREPRHAG